jgi:hypothetical protein
MRNGILAILLGMTVVTFAPRSQAELLPCHKHKGCPHCGATFDCCYEQRVVARCRLQEDVKKVKKTVYEMREVPYCQKRLTCGKCDCPECQACPHYKRVLVKKEITCGEKCETKCVPEETLEWVPVPCCKCGFKGHCK